MFKRQIRPYSLSAKHCLFMRCPSVVSKTPLYPTGGALSFLSAAVSVGEVPESAADVSQGMEITFHNNYNRTEISRRSLIFIERNTLLSKHWLEWLRKKKHEFIHAGHTGLDFLCENYSHSSESQRGSRHCSSVLGIIFKWIESGGV